MPIALKITFETSQADHILTQLRAYKEREFDRNPPRGFIGATVTEEDGKVIFRSDWEDDDALENTRDSAPSRPASISATSMPMIAATRR